MFICFAFTCQTHAISIWFERNNKMRKYKLNDPIQLFPSIYWFQENICSLENRFTVSIIWLRFAIVCFNIFHELLFTNIYIFVTISLSHFKCMMGSLYFSCIHLHLINAFTQSIDFKYHFQFKCSIDAKILVKCYSMYALRDYTCHIFVHFQYFQHLIIICVYRMNSTWQCHKSIWDKTITGDILFLRISPANIYLFDLLFVR